MGSRLTCLALAVAGLAQLATAQLPPPPPPDDLSPAFKATPAGPGDPAGDFVQALTNTANNSGGSLQWFFDTSNDYVVKGCLPGGSCIPDWVGIHVHAPQGGSSAAATKPGVSAGNGRGITLHAGNWEKYTDAKKTAVYLHELYHAHLNQSYPDFAGQCPQHAHAWIACKVSQDLCAIANQCPPPADKGDYIKRANRNAQRCWNGPSTPCLATPQPPPCSCPTGPCVAQPCPQ